MKRGEKKREREAEVYSSSTRTLMMVSEGTKECLGVSRTGQIRLHDPTPPFPAHEGSLSNSVETGWTQGHEVYHNHGCI